MNKSIAVDLDGTLAFYETGYAGFNKIGAPIKPMVDLINKFQSQGYKIKIFTARANNKKNIPVVKEWLRKNGLGDFEVTNVKTPDIVLFIDDRAVGVEKNTGKLLSKYSHIIQENVTGGPTMGFYRDVLNEMLSEMEIGDDEWEYEGEAAGEDGLNDDDINAMPIYAKGSVAGPKGFERPDEAGYTEDVAGDPADNFYNSQELPTIKYGYRRVVDDMDEAGESTYNGPRQPADIEDTFENFAEGFSPRLAALLRR
jgi:hypothetical protein